MRYFLFFLPAVCFFWCVGKFYALPAVKAWKPFRYVVLINSILLFGVATYTTSACWLQRNAVSYKLRILNPDWSNYYIYSYSPKYDHNGGSRRCSIAFDTYIPRWIDASVCKLWGYRYYIEGLFFCSLMHGLAIMGAMVLIMHLLHLLHASDGLKWISLLSLCNPYLLIECGCPLPMSYVLLVLIGVCWALTTHFQNFVFNIIALVALCVVHKSCYVCALVTLCFYCFFRFRLRWLWIVLIGACYPLITKIVSVLYWYATCWDQKIYNGSYIPMVPLYQRLLNPIFAPFCCNGSLIFFKAPLKTYASFILNSVYNLLWIGFVCAVVVQLKHVRLFSKEHKKQVFILLDMLAILIACISKTLNTTYILHYMQSEVAFLFLFVLALLQKPQNSAENIPEESIKEQ
ncbi:MAG: hypothetical protein MJ218_02165 [Opitutales bacterium]|nr:hypothetical protein [Opitutales bacterium]